MLTTTTLESVIDALYYAFKSIKNPGDFAVGNYIQADFGLPGLELFNASTFTYQTISLPVTTEEQAKMIIEQSSRAPFGLGERTVYDDNVRKTWQLNPNQFRITNPEWPTLMNSLVSSKVKSGLGIQETKSITYSLYKLLLYEEGCHFAFHRDTEKEKGMFGTLVIQLPSKYEGGDVIVQHQQKEHKFSFASEAQFKPAFFSFYADCRHQVCPITKGYRICLIYNLIYLGRVDSIPKVINQETIIDNLLKLFRNWNETSHPSKVVYLLKHKYSKFGLNFDGLKGHDSNVVAMLLNAREKEKLFDVHLVLFTKHESGGAYGYDSDEYEAGEVNDIDYKLSNWIAYDNTIVSFPEVEIEEDYIFPKEGLKNLALDNEDFGEHTGNEGASFDRWYTSAALVIWPKSNKNLIYLSFGTKIAIKRLQEMMRNITFPLSDIDKHSTLVNQCIKFAGEIILRWDMGEDIKVMADTLIKLDNFGLVELFCKRVLPKDVTVIVELCSHFGWSRLSSVFTPVFEQIVTQNINESVILAHKLIFNSNIFDVLVDIIIANILQQSLGNVQNQSYSRQYDLSVDHLSFFLATLYNTQKFDKIQIVINYLIEKPMNVPNYMTPLIIELAKQIGDQAIKSEYSFLRLLDYCIECLQRASMPIPPPNDWCLNVNLSCSCNLCQPFEAMLNNPVNTELSLKSNELNRGHVESIIRSATKDVEFTTVKMGSPYTLVVKKKRNIYNELNNKRQDYLMKLQKLLAIRGNNVGSLNFASPALNSNYSVPYNTSIDFNTQPPKKKQKGEEFN
ncbi:hypothetical protein ABK040_015862 [Willaertia magna]